MESRRTEHRALLETEAIVIGYAMSRLDDQFLSGGAFNSWKKAFSVAAAALNVPATSFKNLRDEFDPYHENARRGWHGRPLRTSRRRVMEELQSLSAEALMELVNRILRRDRDAIDEAIRSLANIDRIVYNVAERLLTGRRAEEYFLANCERIIQLPVTQLEDARLSANGFDFRVRTNSQVIEVKGMKELRGSILFTDREWREATVRCEDYLLVVVGGLARQPAHRVFPNPTSVLQCRNIQQPRVTFSWTARIAI